MKTSPTPKRLNRRLLGGTAAAVGLAITLAACGASKVSTITPSAQAATVAPASSAPASSAAPASPAPAANQAGGSQAPAAIPPANGNTPVNGSRPGGGGTRGTIESINGTNLVLDEANGTKVNVVANATTAVTVSKAGSLADFKVGSNVVVLGAADANGVVAATTVTSGSGLGQRPANANANATPPSSNAANPNRQGGATRGAIVSVTGNQMVVTDSASGKPVTVTTSATTKFTLTSVGALSDYKAGDIIVVQGTPDASGTITAVAISPSVARGNFGGGNAPAAPATTVANG